jgi:hypothetical protein
MNLLKFINIPVFILSLAVGLFIVYLSVSDNRKILVYPTPENVSLIQYRDSTGNCFEVKPLEKKCPTNEAEISKIPAQS